MPEKPAATGPEAVDLPLRKFGIRAIPSAATGVLVVDFAALCRNYDRLASMAPLAETAAVIKANGYGLGAREVFQALMDNTKCRTIFVATLDEAMALGPTFGAAKYVLDGLLPETASSFAKIGAHPVLGSLEEVHDWAAYCVKAKKRLPAAIHLDTGMTRLGLSGEEAAQAAANPDVLGAFEVSLVISHLACADEPKHRKNAKQLALFQKLVKLFPDTPKSLANSAGVFLGPDYHFDMTRPGIALYGGRAQAADENPMEPVAWLYGRIAQVRWAERGETAGYGAAYTLKRRSKIATVTAGYADGYFRSVSANGKREGPSGYIGDHELPLVGRVSMDLTMFDATDTPDELVVRGGWVELLGARVTVDDLASFAGTIGYEVLTSLGGRYHRIYVND